ncbi:uncharacterized protein LOC126956106 [Macaca thibetana thibetana]|uniref:uncharacterized protein LOC126956106 n=1 Tax=Macaca thibetana thibetana TaxID=257877 RepID=UPI0021BC6DDC|nr:uncharacterized protein LOC126956106 [Macaca thibetana thibetana]
MAKKREKDDHLMRPVDGGSVPPGRQEGPPHPVHSSGDGSQRILSASADLHRQRRSPARRALRPPPPFSSPNKHPSPPLTSRALGSAGRTRPGPRLGPRGGRGRRPYAGPTPARSPIPGDVAKETAPRQRAARRAQLGTARPKDPLGPARETAPARREQQSH